MTFGGEAGSDAGAIVVSVVVRVSVLYTTARVVGVDFAQLYLREDSPRQLVEHFVHTFTGQRADFHTCWDSVL